MTAQMSIVVSWEVLMIGAISMIWLAFGEALVGCLVEVKSWERNYTAGKLHC